MPRRLEFSPQHFIHMAFLFVRETMNSELPQPLLRSLGGISCSDTWAVCNAPSMCTLDEGSGKTLRKDSLHLPLGEPSRL